MTKSFSEISARYRLRSGTVCALRTGARCVQSQPYCLATTRPERRRCQGCGRSPHPKGMALKTPECRAPSRSSRRADRRSCGSSPSRRVTITTSNPVITLNGTSVHDLFDRWSFDAAVCEKDASSITRLTGFLDSEAASSCSALSDGSLARIVTQTVEKQRMIGAVVDGIAIVLLIGSIFGISAAAEARRMRRVLDARANELLSPGASDSPVYKLGLAHRAPPSQEFAAAAESAASPVEPDSGARTRGATGQEAR